MSTSATDATPAERGSVGPLRATLVLVAGIFLGLVIGFVPGTAGAAMGGDVGDAIGLVGSTAGLSFGFWWAARRISRNDLTGDLRRDYALDFRLRDLWTGLGQSLLARLIGIVVGVAIAVAIGLDLDGDNPQTEGVESAWSIAAFAVAAVVLAPIFEELAFRGVLQQAYVGRFGPVAGVIGAAVPFGLLHAVPGAGWDWAILLSVQTFVLGAWLGRLVHRTGRLGPAIAAHAWHNALAVALFIGVG